jgi:hypothetical protein
VELEDGVGGDADASGVASEAVGEVDGGVCDAGACGGESGVEPWVEAEVVSGSERVSDGAGEPEEVSGRGAGAEEGLGALVEVCGDGDGEGEWVIGLAVRGDVAADEGALPVVGPALYGVEEFVGAWVSGGEEGGGECPCGPCAHGGDVAERACDGLASDEVLGGVVFEVSALDELVDGDDGSVAGGRFEDRGVVTRADFDVGGVACEGV